MKNANFCVRKLSTGVLVHPSPTNFSFIIEFELIKNAKGSRENGGKSEPVLNYQKDTSGTHSFKLITASLEHFSLNFIFGHFSLSVSCSVHTYS